MNEKEFNSQLQSIDTNTSGEEITFDEMEILSNVSSKYFNIFASIFWNNKLQTSQKINNIKALMHQLEDDQSIPFLETKIDGHLQIGKQEELSYMLFFLHSLDRRMTLTTNVGGYETVFT